MCSSLFCFFFFFNDTATTEIYTLSLHDALPISEERLCHYDLNSPGFQRRGVVFSPFSQELNDQRAPDSELAEVLWARSGDKCRNNEIVFPFCSNRWYKSGGQSGQVTRPALRLDASRSARPFEIDT